MGTARARQLFRRTTSGTNPKAVPAGGAVTSEVNPMPITRPERNILTARVVGNLARRPPSLSTVHRCQCPSSARESKAMSLPSGDHCGEP